MSTFFIATTRTQITGLTANVWNRNINVGSFVSVPVGATHVLIEVYQNSGTGTAYGFQTSGATPDNLFTQSNRFQRFEFINLGASNLIDLYTANLTSCRFFIVGYTNHINDVAPFDVSAQVPAANTPTTVTASGLPDEAENGVALVSVNGLTASLHAVGETTIRQWRHIERQVEFVKLNGLKQFIVDSAGIPAANSIVVVGWMPDGSIVWSSDKSARSVSVINTWELQNWVDTNPISIFKTHTDGGSTTQLCGIESGGFTDAGVQSAANANKSNPWLKSPNNDGQFSVRANNTAVQIHHLGSIVANLSSVSITSIDQLIAGQITTIIFSDYFSPTQISISDGGYSFLINSGITQVSSTQISFVCPSPVDNQIGCKTGSVTVVANDGSDTTSEFNSEYVVTAYAAVDLLSVETLNYAAGRVPSLAIGSHCIYQPLRCTLSDAGIFETEEADTIIDIYDRSPSDGKWRLVSIDTSSGSTPSSDRGLTARGLTAVGLTATGITAVGL